MRNRVDPRAFQYAWQPEKLQVISMCVLYSIVTSITTDRSRSLVGCFGGWLCGADCRPIKESSFCSQGAVFGKWYGTQDDDGVFKIGISIA